MPPAFSKTIQQCSIPSLFLQQALKIERKKTSFPTSKGKKRFDVRMVSHDSK